MDEPEQLKATISDLLQDVLGDRDYDDERAQEWTRTAQEKVYEALKKSGYKIVVMCETLSPGSGCVKQQFALQTSEDRCLQVCNYLLDIIKSCDS